MDWLWNLLDPTWWLTLLGAFATIGVLAIIFAETGLLLGFFLPGDSLLVAAGIFSSASVAQGIGIAPLSLPVLLIGTPLCAIAGAQLGHFLGARFGRKLFDKPDSRLFKREHVLRAEEFFEKFGPARAVILARFVPIVRTFMNPVAGVLEMPAKRFFLWNAIGGLVWVESLLLLGHFLGGEVDPKQIDKYILPGVFLIVVISLIPIIVEVVKGKGKGKNLPPPNGKHHRTSSHTDTQQWR
ncbi:DedA family protein [Nonomuraea sp. B12E4]|uniref:DedA family protein n=1 Tax=Nonomuraea sp. B12E4 TaxID=3153564 RepID=UPI00325E557A